MTENEAAPKVGVQRTITTVETPVHESTAADQAEEQIAELLEGLGDAEHKIYVFRRHHRTRKYEFLGPWGVSEFSLEAIQEEYGGGDYRAQGRKGGNAMKGKNAYFVVAGDPKPVRDTDDTAKDAGILAGGALTVAELVRLLSEMRNPPAAAYQGNPAEMAVSLLTALTTAMAPLQAALLEQKNNSGADIKNLLAVFEKGLEIGRGAGDGYGNVIDKFLPVVNRLTESRAGVLPSAVGTERTGGQPVANPPGPLASLPASSASSNGPVPAWVAGFAPWVDYLIPRAENEAPADLYAALVLEEATDAHLAYIAHQLARPEFRGEFFQHFPQAAPLREWWDEFLDSLSEGLTEQPATEVTDGQQAKDGQASSD